MMNSFASSGGKVPEPGSAEISAMVGGISAMGVIIGFVLKQWGNYKNRKIRFMKTLGDNLYFKNLDNNAGVFHRIIDDAEEEECKEALLAYYFLLCSGKGLSSSEPDREIEEWFERELRVSPDFEIRDALRKLNELKLCKIVGENEKGGEIWQAP